MKKRRFVFFPIIALLLAGCSVENFLHDLFNPGGERPGVITSSYDEVETPVEDESINPGLINQQPPHFLLAIDIDAFNATALWPSHLIDSYLQSNNIDERLNEPDFDYNVTFYSNYYTLGNKEYVKIIIPSDHNNKNDVLAIGDHILNTHMGSMSYYGSDSNNSPSWYRLISYQQKIVIYVYFFIKTTTGLTEGVTIDIGTPDVFLKF